MMALEERERVIKEGELLKFRCGLTKGGKPTFVSRWCQVTENRFRYYKNKITAYHQPGKPLVSVPLSDVMGIQK